MQILQMVLMAVAFIGLMSLVVWLVWRWRTYNIKVDFYQRTDDANISIEDKARLYTDSYGVQWWKLLKEKNPQFKLIPIAPDEAISINKKGKIRVTAIRTSDGEVFYLRRPKLAAIPSNFSLIEKDVAQAEKDAGIPIEEQMQTIKEGILQLEDYHIRDQKYKEWKKTLIDVWKNLTGNEFVYEPFTSNQRVMLVNNIRKAEERKKGDWKEFIIPLGFGAMVLIFAICLMIFYGDIAKPVIDARAQDIRVLELQNEQLHLLTQIKQGIQTIGAEIDDEPPN